jgi:hypothetical protein
MNAKYLIGLGLAAFPWSVFVFLAIFLKKKGNKARSLILICAAGLLPSCFSPDLNGVVFRCSDSDQQCGSGYSCNIDAGQCRVSGEDGPPVDLAKTADLPTVIVEGCSNKGTGLQLAADVFLCPGAFSPSSPASQLCAAGWKVPAVWPSNADRSICPQLPAGFMVASISSYPGFMDSMPSCGSIALDNRFVSACGPADSVFSSSVNCAGLFSRYLCNGVRKPNSPKCPNSVTSIDQLTSVTDLGGVVCQRV